MAPAKGIPQIKMLKSKSLKNVGNVRTFRKVGNKDDPGLGIPVSTVSGRVGIMSLIAGFPLKFLIFHCVTIRSSLSLNTSHSNVTLLAPTGLMTTVLLGGFKIKVAQRPAEREATYCLFRCYFIFVGLKIPKFNYMNNN